MQQVKTRTQLEHGKSSTGLIASFKTIIREEGYVLLYLIIYFVPINYIISSDSL